MYNRSAGSQDSKAGKGWKAVTESGMAPSELEGDTPRLHHRYAASVCSYRISAHAHACSGESRMHIGILSRSHAASSPRCRVEDTDHFGTLQLTQSRTQRASSPAARRHSPKQLAHSPQRPRRVRSSFTGSLNRGNLRAETPHRGLGCLTLHARVPSANRAPLTLAALCGLDGVLCAQLMGSQACENAVCMSVLASLLHWQRDARLMLPNFRRTNPVGAAKRHFECAEALNDHCISRPH